MEVPEVESEVQPGSQRHDVEAGRKAPTSADDMQAQSSSENRVRPSEPERVTSDHWDDSD
jgi:hypothetical protein